jgi:hypothetical protein
MLVLAAYLAWLGYTGQPHCWVLAAVFVFWSGYFVVREVRITRNNAEIARLERLVAEERAGGTIGAPCPKCSTPMFTPGPGMAGTGVRVVFCCCPEKGTGPA